MEDSRQQELEKVVENHLHLNSRFYHFQLKRGTSISEHINIYTKLFANLANLDVVIDDEEKVLILLSSLPDEGYETFVLTLINRRTSLSYKKITTTLMNLEPKRKNKECSTRDTSAEVLTARRSSPNQRREINRNLIGSPWLVIAN